MALTTNILTVTGEEAGLKLLRFLSRRLEAGGFSPAQAELHRWIRTGQVRRNGKRAKPFDLLAAGDEVRLPPFAAQQTAHETPRHPVTLHPGLSLGENLTVLAVASDIIALEKGGGLPVQPGSKHTDSVSERLRAHFAGAAYIPAPAHRLDKDTSGIVLAGRNALTQRALHDVFASPDGHASRESFVHKEYLAWVSGIWPHTSATDLADMLEKRKTSCGEKVAVTENGKAARSTATPLRVLDESPFGPATLLCIALHTGRTHQIRVQLASRGFPVLGDGKYGGPHAPRLLLHAHRLRLALNGQAEEFVSFPTWAAPFTVHQAT